MTTSNRRTVATQLKLAATYYWVRLRFGVFNEIGVKRWGSRRVDVLALSMKGELVVCEVKSCKQDYKNDSKWHEYLPFAHRFYFVVSQNCWDKWMNEESKTLPKRVGVLVLSSRTGKLYAARPAQRNAELVIPPDFWAKLAWKASPYSRRTIPRISKVYL
jgi:hypothetical protein